MNATITRINPPCPAWCYGADGKREYCSKDARPSGGVDSYHTHSSDGITQEEYERRLAEYKNLLK